MIKLMLVSVHNVTIHTTFVLSSTEHVTNSKNVKITFKKKSIMKSITAKFHVFEYNFLT